MCPEGKTVGELLLFIRVIIGLSQVFLESWSPSQTHIRSSIFWNLNAFSFKWLWTMSYRANLLSFLWFWKHRCSRSNPPTPTPQPVAPQSLVLLLSLSPLRPLLTLEEKCHLLKQTDKSCEKCPLVIPIMQARKFHLPRSARHAGVREPAGHLRPEAHGLPEAVVQHRRHGRLHNGLRPAAAELLLQHHVPERPGPRAREAGCEAALLLDRGGHPEQPLPAQGHVLLQKRDADQVKPTSQLTPERLAGKNAPKVRGHTPAPPPHDSCSAGVLGGRGCVYQVILRTSETSAMWCPSSRTSRPCYSTSNCMQVPPSMVIIHSTSIYRPPPLCSTAC